MPLRGQTIASSPPRDDCAEISDGMNSDQRQQPENPCPAFRLSIGPRTWFWLLLWGVTVVGGLGYLASYANNPGAAARMPHAWPEDTQLVRNSNGPTLVMFIHPHCPCTRASLSELSRTLARSHEPVDVLAVFIRPLDFKSGWERGSLWNIATKLPGVRTLVDPGGQEARRFDAMTSGQVGLYDRHGKLLFSGGMTSARAHEGDNNGSLAVSTWLNEGDCIVSNTDVFGCPLFDQTESQSERGESCCPR
ncbi:MAG: hypothetical protein MI923_30535 [Phycisphaerales bacterium]|nr:hypothetical protein [Phycisphaerales bacterium]